MNTSILWTLTYDKLVSSPGGVKEYHPLKITETGNERGLHDPRGALRIFNKRRTITVQ